MANLSETNPHRISRDRMVWGVAACLALMLVWRIANGLKSIPPSFADKDKVLASLPWNVGKYDEDNYTWLDNETIIYALPAGQKKYKLMRQKVRGGQPVPAQPIPKTKLLVYPYGLSASPNGKWLAIQDSGAGSIEQCLIYDVNGGELKQNYGSAGYLIQWMAESKSFVRQLHSTPELTQYWVAEPKSERHTLHLIYQNDLVISPQGEFFASNYHSWNHAAPQLERGSIFDGKSQVQTIPTYGLVLDSSLYSVSPQGNRLLWYQEWSGTTTWFAELTGKLTGRGARPVNYEAWYVTDSDGKNPRTWATARFHGYYQGHGARVGLYPKWLPDGKHLSMVYKGALYVVPVP